MIIITSHLIKICCSCYANTELKHKITAEENPIQRNMGNWYHELNQISGHSEYNLPNTKFNKQKSAMILFKDVKNALNDFKQTILKAAFIPSIDNYIDFIHSINELSHSASSEIISLKKKPEGNFKNLEKENLLEKELILIESVEEGFEIIREIINNILKGTKLKIINYFTVLSLEKDATIILLLIGLQKRIKKNIFDSIDIIVENNFTLNIFQEGNQSKLISKLISNILNSFKEVNNLFDNLDLKEYAEFAKLYNEYKLEVSIYKKSLIKEIIETLNSFLDMNSYTLLLMLRCHIEKTTGLQLTDLMVQSPSSET